MNVCEPLQFFLETDINVAKLLSRIMDETAHIIEIVRELQRVLLPLVSSPSIQVLITTPRKGLRASSPPATFLVEGQLRK